jgi:hypothetical protein
MNKYCFPVKLGITDPVRNFDLVLGLPVITELRPDQLNPEIPKILDSVGLSMGTILLFHSKPRLKTYIHKDGVPRVNDLAKLNFVVNEHDSVMNWYDVNPEYEHSELSQTDQSTPYVRYGDFPEQTIWRHSQSLEGCAVVQSACPHNVHTFDHPRWCISIPLAYKNGRAWVDYADAVRLLSTI